MYSILYHNGKGLVTKIVTSAFAVEISSHCGLFVTTLNKPNIFFSMNKQEANSHIRNLCKDKSISIFGYAPMFTFDCITEACEDEDINKVLDSVVM